MKDIYINGKFLCQKITGVQRFAIEICKMLDRRSKEYNIKFHIITPNAIVNNIKFENIDLIFTKGKPNYYWEQWILPRYCKKHKIKELISMCNIAPILFPGSCVLHDLSFIETKGNSFKMRFIYKFITKRNIKKYNHVFTVSDTMKNRIENRFKIKNVCVINNGCEHMKTTEAVKPKFEIPENYYLSVGSMNPNKNFANLIRIAKLNPKDNYLIVGEGHKTFKNNSLDCPENVKFTGYVEDSELTYLYQNAKAFLFPSNYEGFGIPPLEAIVSGTKYLICNDIEVLKELFGNVSSFVSFNTIDSIKVDENSLITEEKKNIVLDKYSWKKSAIKMLEELVED